MLYEVITIAEELLSGLPDSECPYTHVFLQGGVGGLAAGVISHFWERYGEKRPTFVVVEPEQADCLYQSALHGFPSRATGSVDSVMAGLACGETSPLAWRFLQPAADIFMTITDAEAESAMRVLASRAQGDVPVISGESAAAGYAALQKLSRDPVITSYSIHYTKLYEISLAICRDKASVGNSLRSTPASA